MGDGDDPILGAGHDLTALRELLSQDFNGYAQSFQDICFWPPGYAPSRSTTGLTEPDRVLGATLTAIRRYGVAEVRAALSGIERYYQPLDVVLAIDCWVADVLDPATFWRVADGPLVTESELAQRWREEGMEPAAANARQSRPAHLRRAPTAPRRPGDRRSGRCRPSWPRRSGTVHVPARRRAADAGRCSVPGRPHVGRRHPGRGHLPGPTGRGGCPTRSRGRSPRSRPGAAPAPPRRSRDGDRGAARTADRPGVHRPRGPGHVGRLRSGESLAGGGRTALAGGRGGRTRQVDDLDRGSRSLRPVGGASGRARRGSLVPGPDPVRRTDAASLDRPGDRRRVRDVAPLRPSPLPGTGRRPLRPAAA